MDTLTYEIANMRKALEQISSKERQICGTKAALKQGFERAEREQYDRVWAGESIGNVFDDVIVATKGTLDTHATEKFRVLMERLASHRGQFIAGRADICGNFNQVLIGVIGSDRPIFCWEKGEIILPIEPAVSFDVSWRYGFQNLITSVWAIKISKDETDRNGRCYDLEQMWEDATNIHIGDEAVWKFLNKGGNQKYGPIVTFVHVASALGRPLATVPLFKKLSQTFAEELRASLPSLIQMISVLKKMQKSIAPISSNIMVSELFEKTDRVHSEVVGQIEEIQTFLTYVEKPHQIKKRI